MTVTTATRTRRRVSAAHDARREMGSAVAALGAERGVSEAVRLRVAWAWCSVLSAVEVEYLDGLRLLADAEHEIARLRAEVERLRRDRP